LTILTRKGGNDQQSRKEFGRKGKIIKKNEKERAKRTQKFATTLSLGYERRRKRKLKKKKIEEGRKEGNLG